MDEQLTDLERAKMRTFADDSGMQEALRKVLLAGVGDELELLERYRNQIPNDQLGEKIRAVWEGRAIVENRFNQLGRFRTVEPKKETINKAR